MIKSTLFLFLILISGFAEAQQHVVVKRPPNYGRVHRDTVRTDFYILDTLIQPIPFRRQVFHDNINKELLKADMADGVRDSFINFSQDTAQSQLMTRVILKNINKMQIMVENMPLNGRDSFTESQDKIRYLRALWELIRAYNNNPKPNPDFYERLVINMHGMLIACNENKLMDFALQNTDIYTLDNGHDLFESHADVRAYIYTTLGKQFPVLMVKRLPEFYNDTFAPTIINDAAIRQPDLIFNYAMATNYRIREAVRRTNTPIVQSILQIVDSSKSSLKALPFLCEVFRGRMSVAEIDTIADHADLYYENLVRLKIKDDSIGRDVYTRELVYRGMKLIREMNDLHEAKDEERFKCIDSLPPADLFYLIVNGQDEIYTSTFLGSFKRMMQRQQPRAGNQILDTVHYDRFRTFIKMCAGYNTLAEFLNSIPDTGRDILMSSFIGGLQQGNDSDLDEAVDVADAFGSINDSALTVFLQARVKKSYENSYFENSKKGIVIYGLLATLLQTNRITGNDTGADITSKRLLLPPINKVLFNDLVNDSGIIYQEVFFFGDDDGKNSFDSYMGEFKNDKRWKIEDTTYWTKISSTEGKRIIIYANMPLKEPDDEVAQDSLTNYLASQHINPAIIIHRGHSYHLAQTLARLSAGTKIVILGSCGGYHNLAIVLDRSPDAHIVSSKQTGVGAVNEQIIMALNKRLLNGQDVNWIDIWNELDAYFADKDELREKFSDYVPPYKNLGAIFIKSYRRKMR